MLSRIRGGQRQFHRYFSSKVVNPEVACIPHMPTWTCTYVVSCPQTKRCILLDTCLDYQHNSGKYHHAHAESLLKYVEEKKLKVDYILETHVHADHLTAAPYLQQKTNAKIGIGFRVGEVQNVFTKFFNIKEPVQPSVFDFLVKPNEPLKVGNLSVNILSTPGHTPACVTYHIGDSLFTGDTLFMPDIGTARCDFPGGSAEEMWESCQKLLSFPDQTRMFVGHDYPDNRPFRWETSVGEQKEKNKMVKSSISRDEYLKMRKTRDQGLAAPVLLLPSIQVNIRAGHFPTAEDNGVPYLKIPLRAS